MTAGSAIACVIDLLLVPVYILMVAFSGDGMRSGDPVPWITWVFLGGAVLSGGGGILAFVAGLAGAPRRQVQILAFLPIVALIVLVVGGITVSELAQR